MWLDLVQRAKTMVQTFDTCEPRSDIEAWDVLFFSTEVKRLERKLGRYKSLEENADSSKDDAEDSGLHCSETAE